MRQMPISTRRLLNELVQHIEAEIPKTLIQREVDFHCDANGDAAEPSGH